MAGRVAVLAVGLGLVAIAALMGGREPTRAAVPPVPPAAVAALGRLEPRSQLIQLGAAGPDVLADLSVERGSRVTRGEVLGHLQSYAEACAHQALIAAQMDEARARLAAEETLAAKRIHAAEIRLTGIREITPLRLDHQAAAIRKLEVDLANNTEILRAEQRLAVASATSKRSYDNQRAVVEGQRASLTGLQARLAEMKSQSALDIANADSDLAVERAALVKARAEIPIASLERQSAEAAARADRATLRAPLDGTVLNVLVRPGEAVGNGPVLSLGDVDTMHAVAEVYETDIGRVRLGQSATITGRALEASLRGRVVEIGRMIYKNDVLNVDPAAKVDARVVEVRIALDDSAAVAGLTHLTVDVRIDLP